MPEKEKHRCEGQYFTYMRGTICGFGSQCNAPAKVYRNGKHHCLLHDPVQIELREKKREERAEAREKRNLKTYKFKVNGKVHETQADTEWSARAKLTQELQIELIEVK